MKIEANEVVEACLQRREYSAGNAVIDDRCEDVVEVSEARVARYFGSSHVAVRQLSGVCPGGPE
jgi:hypothetical protein